MTAHTYTPTVGERVWFAELVPYLVTVTRVDLARHMVYGRQDDAPSWTLDDCAGTFGTYPDTTEGREKLAQWCETMSRVMVHKAATLREMPAQEVAA